jgi:hypothetical protein
VWTEDVLAMGEGYYGSEVVLDSSVVDMIIVVVCVWNSDMFKVVLIFGLYKFAL